MTKTYEIDDKINGHKSTDKLRNLYDELRRYVFTRSSLQTPSSKLLSSPLAEGIYMWELYDHPVLTVIEYFYGDWVNQFYNDKINRLMLTLHSDPQQEVTIRIEELIAQANAGKLKIEA